MAASRLTPSLGEDVAYVLEDGTTTPATVIHVYDDGSINLIVLDPELPHPRVERVLLGDAPGCWRPIPSPEPTASGRIPPFWPQETIPMTQPAHDPNDPTQPSPVQPASPGAPDDQEDDGKEKEAS